MSKTFFEAPGIAEDTIESLSRKLLAVTEQLTESNHKLQQSEKERSDMLANLSHDLRAPVTAIRGALDYLLEDPENMPDDTVSVLHMLDRRTKTLENLINDMYDLFCLENFSSRLCTEEIDAVSFVEEYFYSTILDSRYETHDMQLDVSDTITCSLCIDIHKIVRVLDNLMTNAAKYSDKNSVIVLKAAMQDSDFFAISVIDHGIGIPEDALDKIFRRTYTVSPSRTPNSATGSGLGLSIAKAILQKHNGTISCRSKLGEGSIFTITLPIVKL